MAKIEILTSGAPNNTADRARLRAITASRRSMRPSLSTLAVHDFLLMLKPGYEKVHTVTDYFDGPREGIADLGGKPHFYRCEWDATSDDWQPFYLLQPLDESTFRLALEDWAIWERWDAAFHQGRTTLDTHPALPDDRARYNELAAILAQRLVIHPAAAIKAVGEFEPIGPKLENHWIAPLQVKWTLVLDATANTPLDRTKSGLEL